MVCASVCPVNEHDSPTTNRKRNHLAEQRPEGSAWAAISTLFYSYELTWFCASSSALAAFIWNNIYRRKPSMKSWGDKVGEGLEGRGQSSKSKGKFCKRQYRNWLGALGKAGTDFP